MSNGQLQRAIGFINKAGFPEAIKTYLLDILEKRKRPVRREARFKPLMMPVPKLKKELDRVFSIFIRTRDTKGETMGFCVTCGHCAPWRDMDCGHYQPRQDLNTRWDEKNCHLQCKPCNGFRGGAAEAMAIYIDKIYGSGTAEILRAKARQSLKLDRHKLQLWINHYKRLIGEPV
jgi:hypothetical protein